MTNKVRIPSKSISDSTVIAISRSAAKRSAVPRQIDQAIPVLGGAGRWTLLGAGVSQVFVLSHVFPLRASL
jgi:hypothetical protein